MKLDVCGLSCPEPVLRLQEALKTNNEVELITDSKNAKNNCADFAEKNGYKVEFSISNGVYRGVIKK